LSQRSYNTTPLCLPAGRLAKPTGISWNYTKNIDASAEPAELFFYYSEARHWSQQRLAAPVADVSSRTEQWFVACRNGRVYASR
jgi:hypothetical protein